MAMHPCDVCDESEFDCQSAVVMAEGDLASRYTGECAGCGTGREFLFRLPETVTLPGHELRFGGPEPSELLDAGEWLWAATNFAATPVHPAGPPADLAADAAGGFADAAGGFADAEPSTLSAEELAEARADLAGAVAAVDEVLKFLPDGADEPPESAFWSARGRQLRASQPDAFRRDRLEARRAAYRAALATLP
ncbi:hypothetical protein WEI85_30445 [Actinomycetes bacterium KLBMP 9797]